MCTGPRSSLCAEDQVLDAKVPALCDATYLLSTRDPELKCTRKGHGPLAMCFQNKLFLVWGAPDVYFSESSRLMRQRIALRESEPGCEIARRCAKRVPPDVGPCNQT